MKSIAMNTPNQTQKDRARRARINSSTFDPAFISEGGPIFTVLSCGHTTPRYRKNYVNIKWDKD